MTKILIIVNTWPSKGHPYISQLYEYLFNEFEDVDLFVFKKGDLSIAFDQIEPNSVKKIANNIKTRPKGLLDVSGYINLIRNLIFNPLVTGKYFQLAFKNGQKAKNALSQFYFFSDIIIKKYDLVYITALQTAMHFHLKSVFKNAKVLSSSRGQDFELFPTRYNGLIQNLDHIHVISEFLEKQILDRGISQNSITRIEPAVDISLKDISDIKEKGKSKVIISTISRLEWIKGTVYAIRAIDILLKSFDQVRNAAPFEFQIIGSGTEREFLEMEVHRLGLQEYIIFSGWKDRKEIRSALAKTHIYVLLALAEGFNNSVIEAQNNGCACIVSNSGGLPENVKDQVTGFVVDPLDTKAIADKLSLLITDPVLRNRMGYEAIKRVEKKFDTKDQQLKFKNLFNQLLQEKQL